MKKSIQALCRINRLLMLLIIIVKPHIAFSEHSSATNEPLWPSLMIVASLLGYQKHADVGPMLSTGQGNPSEACVINVFQSTDLTGLIEEHGEYCTFVFYESPIITATAFAKPGQRFIGAKDELEPQFDRVPTGTVSAEVPDGFSSVDSSINSLSGMGTGSSISFFPGTFLVEEWKCSDKAFDPVSVRKSTASKKIEFSPSVIAEEYSDILVLSRNNYVENIHIANSLLPTKSNGFQPSGLAYTTAEGTTIIDVSIDLWSPPSDGIAERGRKRKRTTNKDSTASSSESSSGTLLTAGELRTFVNQHGEGTAGAGGGDDGDEEDLKKKILKWLKEQFKNKYQFLDNLQYSDDCNKAGQPRRPMNSFMVFSTAIRPVLSKNCPAHNSELSRWLGVLWSHADGEIRNKADQVASRLKIQFQHLYPEHSYRLTKKARKNGSDYPRYRPLQNPVGQADPNTHPASGEVPFSIAFPVPGQAPSYSLQSSVSAAPVTGNTDLWAQVPTGSSNNHAGLAPQEQNPQTANNVWPQAAYDGGWANQQAPMGQYNGDLQPVYDGRAYGFTTPSGQDCSQYVSSATEATSRQFGQRECEELTRQAFRLSQALSNAASAIMDAAKAFQQAAADK